MFKVGVILFAFGITSLLGASLQRLDFFTLFPSYFSMICGAGLLFLAEWRNNKDAKKKVSVLALACFFLAYLGWFFPLRSKWFFLSISLVSINCGVVFLVKYTKDPNKKVGKTLSVTGIIMSGIIFLVFLLAVIFNIKI